MNTIDKELKEQYQAMNEVLNKQVIVSQQAVEQHIIKHAPLQGFDWGIYFIVVLAILIVMVKIFTSPVHIGWIILMVGILAIVIYLFGLTPKRVELTTDGIIVHQWLGKHYFPFAQIESAQPFKYEGNTIRLFGTSGVKASIGWFSNSKIGIFQAFVSNKYEAILLVMKDGKKKVLSCEHSSDVLDYMNAKLQ